MHDLGQIENLEVVVFVPGQMVPLAKQRADLIDGRGHLFGAGGLGLNEVDARLPHRLRRIGRLRDHALGIERRGCDIRIVQGIDRRRGGSRGGVHRSGADAVDAELDRRPGGEDAVVLVLAHHVRAAGAQEPDDPEGDVADADRLADGRFVFEQFALDRGADQADAVARADVVLGEVSCLRPGLPNRGWPGSPARSPSVAAEPSCVFHKRPGPWPRPWARRRPRRDTAGRSRRRRPV